MYRSKELLSEFETLSTAEWMQRIEKFLKGKPFGELMLELEGGIELKPFYRKEDNNKVALPLLNSNDWLIAESFVYDGTDAKLLNTQLLKALENGTNALTLILEGGKAADLTALLDSVYLEMIDLNLSGKAFEAAPADWLTVLSTMPSAQKSKGFALADNNTVLQNQFSELLPGYSFFNFNIKIDKNAVSSLSELLKDINSAFESLINTGMTADEAQNQINIHVTLSDDYFLSIAFLRALKRLWLGLIEAYGVADAIYPKIHTYTAVSAVSSDPYWNLISNTTQALSAAIAQVYSITVRPTDESEEKGEFSRRIARNVQQLLKMESHIDQITDPSAGAYYIENYTAALVQHAWAAFVKA